MIWAGLLDRGGWRLGGSVLRRAAMRFVEAEVDVGAGSVQPGGGRCPKIGLNDSVRRPRRAASPGGQWWHQAEAES